MFQDHREVTDSALPRSISLLRSFVRHVVTFVRAPSWFPTVRVVPVIESGSQRSAEAKDVVAGLHKDSRRKAYSWRPSKTAPKRPCPLTITPDVDGLGPRLHAPGSTDFPGNPCRFATPCPSRGWTGPGGKRRTGRGS